MISRAWLECRLPVGSSARMTDGLAITARATPTSCCCPPDNWLGYRVLLSDDTKPVKAIGHHALALRSGDVAIRQRHIEVFVDGQVVEQMIALKHEAKMLFMELGPVFWFQRMNRVAIEIVFAAPVAVVHPEQMEERRFACAGRPHHGHEVPRRNIERNISQHEESLGSIGERLLDSAQRDEGLDGHCWELKADR